MVTVNGLPDGVPTSQELIANTPEDESQWNWTTVSVGVNRRFRDNFFWNAYFDYQWRHEARRSNNESTSPLTTDPTNVDWNYSYGPIPLVQDLTNWQGKTAGRYVFPHDIGAAATLRVLSGFNWSPDPVHRRSERRFAAHLPRQPRRAAFRYRDDPRLPRGQDLLAGGAGRRFSSCSTCSTR